MAVAAVSFANSVLDGALNIIKNNATTIELLSTSADALDVEANTYSQIVTDNTLGNATVSYGVSDPVDATSGRKITVTSAEGTVDTSGTGSAYALTNGTDTVYAIGDLTDQVVTSGNTFTIAPFEVNFTDPTIPS